MAAPGYPQMGQMPPMGGPPMGAQPMPRPVRQGTSKAVPVVVSAGLAVGVFCGLLFGVGTGKDAAVAAPASGNNVKKDGEAEPMPEPGAAPKGLGATAAQPVPPKNTGSAAGSGSAVVAAAGSGAGSAAPTVGAGSGSAKPAVEEKKVIKLTFKPKPEAAAEVAKISIDGEEIDGLTTEIPFDTKSIKIEVKASGYKTFTRKQDIVPGEEMAIEFEMSKKSTVRPPRRPTRPTNAGGGGLIDI